MSQITYDLKGREFKLNVPQMEIEKIKTITIL